MGIGLDRGGQRHAGGRPCGFLAAGGLTLQTRRARSPLIAGFGDLAHYRPCPPVDLLVCSDVLHYLPMTEKRVRQMSNGQILDASALRIGHTVMRDAIDAAPVRRLLRERFGLDPDTDAEAIGARLVNLLAKAEASPDGAVRGQRHTMLNDSDINATRHARAAVGTNALPLGASVEIELLVEVL